MPVKIRDSIRGPALVIDFEKFIERLNDAKTSQLVQAWARRYATTGHLNPKLDAGHWDLGDMKPVWAELGQVTMAHIVSGIPHQPFRGVDFALVNDWLALTSMYRDHIQLKICPEPDCRRFFADAKRRGKSACSPEHANRQRARKHYAKLQTNKRKYRTYLKKQRDLMKARRAEGLA